MSLALEITQRFPCLAGFSIGRVGDKTTWRPDYKDDATEEDRAAVASYIAGLVDPALSVEKKKAAREIDDAAENIRLRYITPGAGMALTYQEKFAQAQAVQAMGEEAANAMSQADRELQFPTLSASVGIEAQTLWACAALVLERYTQFAALSFAIERARLSGKAAVAAASTVQGVQEAREAIAWPTP